MRPTYRTCLSGLAAIATLTVVAATNWAAPASAASVPSPTPTVTAIVTPAVPAGMPQGIEDLSPYVEQASCDPVAKPGATELARLLDQTYPGTSSGIARACGVDGIASEHYEGRAIDWMISVRKPAEAAEAKAVLDWLFATDAAGHPYANARRLGVMYLIWNNHIWGAYDTSAGWRPYSNCADHPEPGYDTACHRNHIHVSLSWAGAMGRTSFWTKKVAPVDYGPCRPADLNWALPYSTFSPTPCPSYPAVNATAGSAAGTAALFRYSGILLGSGATGSPVSAVQTALGVGVDGGYGPLTEAAVSAFRTAHGLPAGGTVDPATWRALLAAAPGPPVASGRTAPRRPTTTTPATTSPSTAGSALAAYASTVLRYGNRGPAVLALQKGLKVTPTSGWFGPATRGAVTMFQQSHHLPATGIVNAATWHALGG